MPARRPVSHRSHTPRARYAQELAALRRKAGASLRALGDAVGCDHSHLAQMEHGNTLGGPELARSLDKYYGTTHLAVLWDLALQDPSQFRERYRKYMALEAQAVDLQQYSPNLLPGLLQTPAYASALLRPPGRLDEAALAKQVAARMGRQERLSHPDAPQFRVIICESALRRPLPDRALWHEQLAHLHKVSQWPNIVVQVLPFASGAHYFTSTPLMLLGMADGTTTAYVETHCSSELIEEARAVVSLRMSYDQVRDRALSPHDSSEFITHLMEDAACETPESMCAP